MKLKNLARAPRPSTLQFTRLCGGLVAATFLLAAMFASAQDIPPPPRGERVLPAWQELRDAKTAGTSFTPMAGSLPAQWEPGGLVRLPVNFAGTRHARVSWDFPFKVDLRAGSGIQFDFYCRNLEPMAGFSIYFRSGKGWYNASFDPEREGSWQRIVIDKSATKTEGECQGWNKIDLIRISGWRGEDRDTQMALANMALAGAVPEILVVRADSCAQQGGTEAASYATYAQTLSSALHRLGLPVAQVSDFDLAPELLAGIKLVVLPYNTALPPGVAALLENFIGRGGKLLVCYSLPGEIGRLLGLRATGSVVPEPDTFTGFAATDQSLPGQPAFAPQASWRSTLPTPLEGRQARVAAVWRDKNGVDTSHPAITLTSAGAYFGHVWLGGGSADAQRLILAVVGELMPGIWRQVAADTCAKIGAVAGHPDFASFSAVLKAGKPSRQARRELALAEKLHTRAQTQMSAGAWDEAIDTGMRAAETARQAWLMTRPSRAGEHRAFWCHSAFGMPGLSWDEAIKTLKDNGFNAILPNMLWGGVAYYPSSTLPVYGELEARGDQMAACLTACRRHGVACHVWKVNWNMSSRAPASFVAEMTAAGRVQKTYSGEIKNTWLCPSHPLNQDLEVESMLELARNYAVDGLHFDYIRYPDSSTCFCDGCRARFEARLGRAVPDWPRDTRVDKEIREAWLDFRRSNIDSVVRRVSAGARAIRPGIQISAAVFSAWSTDRDGVGQDWKMWCEEGWLDFVCPMNYTESNRSFRSQVARQKEWVGKARLYPGIGLSCWKDSIDAIKLAEQIEVARELGAPGFTVFNYGSNALKVIPQLHLGVTSKR